MALFRTIELNARREMVQVEPNPFERISFQMKMEQKKKKKKTTETKKPDNWFHSLELIGLQS